MLQDVIIGILYGSNLWIVSVRTDYTKKQYLCSEKKNCDENDQNVELDMNFHYRLVSDCKPHEILLLSLDFEM